MRCVNRSPKGRLPSVFVLVAASLVLIVSTGCGSPNWSGSNTGNTTQPASPAAPGTTTTSVPILLYVGTGTSSGDVSAVESVLSTNNLKYSTADTSQIDAMSESQLATYKLLIVPGGNSITIGNSLTANATTNIHNAVLNDGLHYLGICAGAFFGGYSIHNGLNLTNGVWFNFYADEFKGIHKEPVLVTFSSGTSMDMYWQDGPQLTGWGDIVSKYPDGTPSMVEGKSGNGWMILSGVHPEAPATWRTGMTFTTSVAADQAYAVTLINSALAGTSLPHY